MKIPFGPWTPDKPPLVVGRKGLVTCSNVVPRSEGYGPLPSFSAAGYGSLDARCRGHIAVVSEGGIPFNFSGDGTKLYKLSSYSGAGPGTIVDCSKSGGYALASYDKWEMVNFGNAVLAVSGTEAIQYFNLSTSSLFSDVVDDGSAPVARHIGVITNHVMVGDTYDVEDARVVDQVWWPAINNPLSWPTPGTDTAMIAQSGKQKLRGDGGWIQSIISGVEIGAIFQEHKIWRVEYVGGDTMFQFDGVEGTHGVLVSGLAIPRGREILYLDEDGWYTFDYTESVPVGEDIINRTFLADLDQSYLHMMSWFTDPDSPNTFILYPGSGNSGGIPNKLLIWNWVTRSFSEADPGSLEHMAIVLPPAASLDADPQVEDLDTVNPDESFDDRPSAFGAAVIGAYNTSHTMGTFSGTAMLGTLDTGDIEMEPGRRAHVKGVRPLVRGGKATVQIAGINTQDEDEDDIDFGPIRRQARDGVCGARIDARYHRIRTNLPAGFDDAIGLDIDFRPTGRY